MQEILDLRQKILEMEEIPEKIRRDVLENIEKVEENFNGFIDLALNGEEKYQEMFDIASMEDNMFNEDHLKKFLLTAVFFSVINAASALEYWTLGQQVDSEEFLILDLTEPWIKEVELVHFEQGKDVESYPGEFDYAIEFEPAAVGFYKCIERDDRVSKDVKATPKNTDLIQKIQELTSIPENFREMALDCIDEVEDQFDHYYNEMLASDVDLYQKVLGEEGNELTPSQFNHILTAAIFYTVTGCIVFGNDAEFEFFDGDYYVYDVLNGIIVKSELVYVEEEAKLDYSKVPPYEYKSGCWDLRMYFFNSIDEKRLLNTNTACMN